MKELSKAAREYFKAMGKLGGEKGGADGGRKSASKLTPEQRQDRARKAAEARWRKPATTS